MTEIKKEDSSSDFSRERFLNAVNASKVKLSQTILDRQEREAKINNASKPVAKTANDDNNLKKNTRSCGQYVRPKEAVPDFPSWARSRIANHKSKGISFPQVDFETKTKNTLRKVSSKPLVPITSTPKPSTKEELSNISEDIISKPPDEDLPGIKVISPECHKTVLVNSIKEEEKNSDIKDPEILTKISELVIEEKSPQPECRIKDTIKDDIKIPIEELVLEIVNKIPGLVDSMSDLKNSEIPGLVDSMSDLKISESESNGSAKEVERVNPGHGTLPINFSLTTLELSPHPKLPEDIKVNGNDLEKVIEAELVPAVINAKKKDPNLTEVQSTAIDSNDKSVKNDKTVKNLIECKALSAAKNNSD